MCGEYDGYGSVTVPCFTKSCWTRMGWYVGALSWINIQEFTAHFCVWVYQIVCRTQCSTYIYLSLFLLALLEMISLCMASWLLKKYLQIHLSIITVLATFHLPWWCWWFQLIQLALSHFSSPIMILHRNVWSSSTGEMVSWHFQSSLMLHF